MHNIFLDENTWRSTFLIKNDEKIDAVILYGTWFYNKIIPLLEKHISRIGETSLPNIYIGNIGDKKVIYGCVYGPTMIGEIIHGAGVLKIPKVVLIGSCGGLDENSPDVLVPNSAIQKDGVSLWYPDVKAVPDKDLLNDCLSFLSKENIPFDDRGVATFSSMLMEQKSTVDELRQQGLAGIDLETATMFTIANYFSIKSISILLKSERILEDGVKFLEKEKRNILREKLIDCVCKVV